MPLLRQQGGGVAPVRMGWCDGAFARAWGYVRAPYYLCHASCQICRFACQSQCTARASPGHVTQRQQGASHGKHRQHTQISQHEPHEQPAFPKRPALL
jgi:hypothetical protein